MQAEKTIQVQTAKRSMSVKEMMRMLILTEANYFIT